MRDVDSILDEAGRQWRAGQPEPARLDPVLFARYAPRRRLRLDLSFLAGAASAAAVLAVVAAVAWSAGFRPAGAGGPVSPTADPSTGYIPPGVEHCPLTRPEPRFEPPNGVPPYPGEAWYGTKDLYTMLSVDGERWIGLSEGPGGFGQKTFWWREGYDSYVEPVPEIFVTGRQLDGPGSFGFGPGTNASADGWTAMLVGVNVPAAGCWELTARYRRASLSIVVWVGG